MDMLRTQEVKVGFGSFPSGKAGRKGFFCSLLLLALSLSLFAGCDKGDEVLASYEKDQKTHTMRRQELRWIIKMQNQGSKTQKPSTALQQQILKSYLFSEVIAQEKAEEAQESEYYQKQAIFLEEKAKLASYELYLREEGESLHFEFLEAQIVFFPKDKSESGAKEAALSKEKEALLKELNSPKLNDEDIEDKVYQISEHPQYRLQGGYLDPMCISCATNPFSDMMKEIEKAKANKFIAIHRPNAIMFLRVIKRYTIDEDEVKDKLESFYRKRARVARKYINKLGAAGSPQRARLADWFKQDKMEELAEQQANWLLKKEKASYTTSKINELRKKRKYKVHEAGQLQADFGPQKVKKDIVYKADTPLYSLDSKDYSYGDLQKEIEELQKNLKTKEPLDEKQKIRIMRAFLIPLRLLEEEKDFQKLMEGPLYKFVYNFIKNRLITLSYYDKERNKIEVSQAEVLKNYQKNKDTLYKGRKRAEALKLSRAELQRALFSKWQKEKQEELSKKYKFRIKSKLLKADKV